MGLSNQFWKEIILGHGITHYNWAVSSEAEDANEWSNLPGSCTYITQGYIGHGAEKESQKNKKQSHRRLLNVLSGNINRQRY